MLNYKIKYYITHISHGTFRKIGEKHSFKYNPNFTKFLTRFFLKTSYDSQNCILSLQ